MRFQREKLKERGIVTAEEIKSMRNGSVVRVAGAVICRQQPATAKGFVFVSMEDETGIVNAILPPRLFDIARATVVREPYLVIDGVLQNQQGVVSVKAGRVRPLSVTGATPDSHDFC
jgi:error-prone DNA polymerase